VRRLFNNSRREKNPQSWELYRQAQRRYRKEVRPQRSTVGGGFCNSINDRPMSAKLHRAFSRDPKNQAWLSGGSFGNAKEVRAGNLQILRAIHFTSSVDTVGMAAPAAVRRAKRCNWRVAAEVITFGRFE
jgi:hypothetical protein